MFHVIVPIYNVEKYIADFLDSLIAQDYKDAEFILVDDGSTDKSGEISDTYAQRDKRVRVYHTENLGVSAARNFGICQITPPTNWLINS